MRVKLFTFRYSATLGGFDDGALERFLRDKELVAFREHFYCVNEVPHVTCVATYQDAVVPPEVLEAAREVPRREARPARTGHTRQSRGTGSSSAGRPDVTADLSEPERALFNTLREWRVAKAHDEGVPPYLVFTNRHLVEIVKQRPESPTALGNLPGIGRGKVQRYAAEVLRVLHGASAEAQAPTSPTAAGAPAESARAAEIAAHAETDEPAETAEPAPEPAESVCDVAAEPVEAAP